MLVVLVLKKREKKPGTLPLGLSSSMATIVAGGPDRESLHSGKRKKSNKKRSRLYLLSTSPIYINAYREEVSVEGLIWEASTTHTQYP